MSLIYMVLECQSSSVRKLKKTSTACMGGTREQELQINWRETLTSSLELQTNVIYHESLDNEIVTHLAS